MSDDVQRARSFAATFWKRGPDGRETQIEIGEDGQMRGVEFAEGDRLVVKPAPPLRAASPFAEMSDA